MTISRQALKNIARLKQKKFRIAEGKFLIEGARLVQEALQSDWSVDNVVQTHDFKNNPWSAEISRLAQKRKTNHFIVSQADFKKIADTKTSQGIAAVVSNKNYSYSTLGELQNRPDYFFIAIESLTDPGNLGTIIRTAAWFGIDAVILGRDCVAWHNPKVLRATMGAIFHLPVVEIPGFHEFLADAKWHQAEIYLADQCGEARYTELNYARQKILLIGNETSGISNACQELADYRVAIPRQGKGESLNAAVAAAILMAELSKPPLERK